jgi:TIR domain
VEAAQAVDNVSEDAGAREAKPSLTVFLSYRREDTQDATDRLAESLINWLGKDQVFLDVDSIEIGAPFAEVIDEWVARCDAFLAVIGRGWLTATDEEGARRLDNPRDYVRLEVEAALARKIRVVPVLVHAAQMPKDNELPGSLVPLLGRHAIELTRTHWDVDVQRLIKALERAAAEDRRKAERQRAEQEAKAAQEAEEHQRAEQEAKAAQEAEEHQRAEQEAKAAQEAEEHQRAEQEAKAAQEAARRRPLAEVEERAQRGAQMRAQDQSTRHGREESTRTSPRLWRNRLLLVGAVIVVAVGAPVVILAASGSPTRRPSATTSSSRSSSSSSKKSPNYMAMLLAQIPSDVRPSCAADNYVEPLDQTVPESELAQLGCGIQGTSDTVTYALLVPSKLSAVWAAIMQQTTKAGGPRNSAACTTQTGVNSYVFRTWARNREAQGHVACSWDNETTPASTIIWIQSQPQILGSISNAGSGAPVYSGWKQATGQR